MEDQDHNIYYIYILSKNLTF